MEKKKAVLHYQEQVEQYYHELERENVLGGNCVIGSNSVRGANISSPDLELFLSELRQLMEESSSALHRAA